MLRKNISVEEIECNCGCGLDKISPATLDIVQDVREHFKKPVFINNRGHSACRCEKHNAEVGGSENSKHKPDEQGICRAIDFEVDGVTPKEVFDYLNTKYPNNLAIGLYDTFVHINDAVTERRRWNKSSKWVL